MALLSYIVECLDARITGYYKGSRSFGLCAIHGPRGGGRNVVADEKGNEIPISDYNNPSFWHRHLGTTITTDQASGRGSELEQTATVNMVLVAYAKRNLVGNASALGESLSSLLQTIPDNWFNALGYRTLQVRPNSVTVEPLAVLSAQFANLQVDTSPDSVLVSVTYSVEAKYLPSCIVNTLCASGAVNCLEISCLPEPITGPRGPRGYSAFEVAQIEGFTGTVTEWLVSLIGPKGEKGEKGDKGDNGDPASNLVTSVFGRQGIVIAEDGDYNAGQVDATPTSLFDGTSAQIIINQVNSYLEAVNPNFVQVNDYINNAGLSQTPGTVVLPQDAIITAPFTVYKTISIDQVRCIASSAGSAGSLYRLLLLNSIVSANQHQPNSLLLNTGDLAGNTTAVRVVDFSNLQLTPGIYWWAFWCNAVGTAPTMRAVPLTSLPNLGADESMSTALLKTRINASRSFASSVPLLWPGGVYERAVLFPFVTARRSA